MGVVACVIEHLFSVVVMWLKTIRYEVLTAVLLRVRSSGMWHCVVQYVGPYILRVHGHKYPCPLLLLLCYQVS